MSPQRFVISKSALGELQDIVYNLNANHSSKSIYIALRNLRFTSSQIAKICDVSYTTVRRALSYPPNHLSNQQISNVEAIIRDQIDYRGLPI